MVARIQERGTGFGPGPRFLVQHGILCFWVSRLSVRSRSRLVGVDMTMQHPSKSWIPSPLWPCASSTQSPWNKKRLTPELRFTICDKNSVIFLCDCISFTGLLDSPDLPYQLTHFPEILSLQNLFWHEILKDPGIFWICLELLRSVGMLNQFLNTLDI